MVNLDADNIAGPGFVLDVLQRFGQLAVVSGRVGETRIGNAHSCDSQSFCWEILGDYIYNHIYIYILDYVKGDASNRWCMIYDGVSSVFEGTHVT